MQWHCIADSPSHSARPCNGRSPFPSSCSSRGCWRPRDSGVGNGSACQAVVWTPDPHPISYPSTHNTQNHMRYSTYSPRPLPTACHGRRAQACVLGGRPVASMGHGHLQKRPGLAASRGPCWWARWATLEQLMSGSMGSASRFSALRRGEGGVGGLARV